MDFQDSPEEAAYRAQVRAWLAEQAPACVLPAGEKLSDEEIMRRARRWQAAKADAGYVGIVWPKAAGGQGGSPIQHVIFHQEEEHYRLPTMQFAVGVGMCLPTVFTHGSPEVAKRYVPPGMRGEEIWCQLFSEPSAGSDLAAARTRAVRDGDDWVINGQKVWTSFAHEADFGLLLARTDPSVPKHKGLTMFFIDMRAPGVEVRPIRTMYGDAEFNEVFFTDLRIPDSQRLGALGEGWKVSLTTLMFERLAVGGKPAGSPGVTDLIALMSGLGEDPLPHAEALARFYVADQGIALTRMRLMTALSRGGVPGPEASISKLVVAKNLQDMSAWAQELVGNLAIDNDEASPVQRFNYWQMWSSGLRIAGGTDEILRNIIAERVLQLPADFRPDRDVPFNQTTA
ncbi:acyl-CoA dehydrogenase family protein [Paraburkholderia dinghuensis]|uniref:Acyl-CoA dehydrogenase n=1 Tax=Paraburkholderia dinghuensis TaxID=2305225 RepID=A0A3N6PSR7_9BURK|nr:acyl-CoA dehydrogenase family protein [Paraburkholderia dinghuensis]RQH05050.1 acyl-CoA dehydrogenase [Paraburkholderia dinghuensis]